MVGDLGTTADDYGAFVRRLDLGRNGPRAAIKDSLDIQGVPTQAGSRAYANAPVPTRNARVVQALVDAGWHIVGKTHMHELAYGVTGINAWAGTPRNPRWPERVPGGSSSGSAVAVAAGLVDVAIGTDTGGSIRVPATCCGVIGLKPTFGRISREGVHPRVSSLDCVGPFARELEQIDAAMSILDPAYRALPTPDALRIGYLSTEAEPWVDAAVRAHVLRCEQHVAPVELRSFGAAFTAGITVIASENWSSYGHLTDTDTLGADVRARLLAAREVTPQAVADAEQIRRRFSAEIDAVLEQVDVIALPTLADYPMTLTEAADAKRSLRLTALVRQFNLSGHPALTLPLVGSAGLPVGLQLVGRRGGDAALCAAARLLL